MIPFCLATFKIPSLSFESFNILCLGVSLFEFTWSSLSFSLLEFIELFIVGCLYAFFHQIWEVFRHYFFKYYLRPFLFLFFSGTPMVHMLVHLMVSHRSLRLCSLFLIHLFWFCSSDSIISLSALLLLVVVRVSTSSHLKWLGGLGYLVTS